MFDRPNTTYHEDPRLLDLILQDEANPINRISRLIPEDSKVLDIGAGNGILAQVINRIGKRVTIDGVETNAYAAGLAKSYYRKFYLGLFQDIKPDIIQEDYDFIVLADVIEHVENPLMFLRQLSEGLSNKTKIILSVPHVAHWTVRLSLLNGGFNYTDSGLLERTHLRFFTLKTLSELFIQLQFNIQSIYFLQRGFCIPGLFWSRVRLGLFSFIRLLSDDLARTYQFVVILSKREVITEKKCYSSRGPTLFRQVLYAFIPAVLFNKMKKIIRRIL